MATEKPLIPEEVIKDLEVKHEEVFRFMTQLGEIAFRHCRRSEYQRLQDKLSSGKGKLHAMEEFVKACLIYPDVKAFDVMLDKRPFILGHASEAFTNWCNGEDPEVEGKD